MRRPFAAAAAAAARTATHADVVSAVAAALSRLGLNPGLGAEVCDGLLTVDLALQVGADKRLVALDITPRPPDVLAAQRNDPEPAATGRPRPVDTPQRAWALAQARRQALKAHGWRYVQLPAVEWLGAMGDHEEEDAMLKERVLAVAAEDDQGGHVCGSGCSH
jgi:hypothetical protein